MQNKIVIAIVAILMATSFAGIVCVGDDSDAAVTSPITISTAEGEYIAGNSITIADDKVSGTLKEGVLIPSAPAVPPEGDNPGTPAVEEVKGYRFTLIVNGLSEGQNVYYVYKDSNGVIESAQGTSADAGKADIKFEGSAAQIKEKTADFKFIVTSATISEGSTGVALFNEMFATIGQAIEFDLQYSGDIIEVRYVVGDLIYVKTAMKDSAYTLVALDALNAPTPERQKFVGWEYVKGEAKNVYPAGSAVTFTEDSKLTAVFEALPEAVITFVDGTSTLKSINVSDLSEKTVPSVEKTGYTFDGWFMGDVKVDPLTYTFEESVTLVAQWTPINCYVTFVAGDFVKTVPVLYGDRVQAPALPDGFEKWNFDFSVIITDDLTITAVEKAPEKPTGLADPTVKMAMVIVGLFVCVLLAVIILKREDIRAGMVRKLSKTEEDKKE